jgi:hypothetical protein
MRNIRAIQAPLQVRVQIPAQDHLLKSLPNSTT